MQTLATVPTATAAGVVRSAATAAAISHIDITTTATGGKGGGKPPTEWR